MSVAGAAAALPAKRVFALGPMPPEKLAYALARYSRSPDSITDSLEWVRTHDSAKFLESFYFQYGHASIADLGHLSVCFEGVSELAATEIEDEQLWDGQARSSRYQDFSKSTPVTPPELTADETTVYREASDRLLASYRVVQERALSFLQEQLPQPADMKPDAYRRNLAARAFDVARYLLPLGIPTGVGQVTSIRTLEKQIRRLKASEFQELREIAQELANACAAPPPCVWSSEAAETEPVAPTLARHADADESAGRLRADLTEWASHRLDCGRRSVSESPSISSLPRIKSPIFAPRYFTPLPIARIAISTKPLAHGRPASEKNYCGLRPAIAAAETSFHDTSAALLTFSTS